MRNSTKNNRTSASRRKVSTKSSMNSRIVESPRGRQYPVDNITAFARKHKLDRSSLSRLVNGIRATHKNWTLVG